MTFGGLIHRSTAGRKASKRLPVRSLNRLLVLEALECRLCPVLTLTQAGISEGFRLSIFATDFVPSNGIGPLGVAFPDSGGVLVSARNGGVRRFPNDTDGQSAAWISPSQNYGTANAFGLAKVGANIYMAQNALGKVVQINDDGTLNQVIVSGLTSATGLVTNPLTGHMFVASIFDVDPKAHTSKRFVNVSGADGLAITADSRTLFAARPDFNQVVGYDIATARVVFGPVPISGGPDGIAVGTGRFEGHLYVNTRGGTVVDVDMATPLTPTVIANQGSRGDLVTPDPNDGSLLVTQSDRIIRLKFPTGPATSFRIDASANYLAGRPFGVTVTALDSYGAVATGYTGTVTFTSSDAHPSLLPADYTFTQSDKGTHIFGAVLFTAGAQTLTAQDKAIASITGTTTIAVTSAPANHLLTTAPLTTLAGSPFDLTITALDPYGNRDTNYRGTVTFSSSDTTAGVVLPADYTFTSTDVGTHKFSDGAILLRAGSQTITATAKANGSLMANATVAVTPAPASHLVLRLPTNTTSGMPFDVTVTALDPYGNTDTNYGGTVTFTSSDTDPAVILPGDYAFQSTDSGTHTFSAGVTFITPGDQTLTATDTTNGTITASAIITVVPGPTAPRGGLARRPWSPAVPTDSPPAQSVSSGRGFAAVDRFFASLNEKDSGVIRAQSKHSRPAESHWRLPDDFPSEDTLLL
jgi:hypothetical protein